MRVFFPIEADNAEDALSRARELEGFEVDEAFEPAAFSDGKFIVAGVADAKLIANVEVLSTCGGGCLAKTNQDAPGCGCSGGACGSCVCG